MSGYLFVHFTGEHKDGEQIYFALSKDGLFWKDLNSGKPVLYSKIGEKGVRDPFLVRDPKKKKYYLIATDLRIEAGKGWDAAQRKGSRDLIVWESEDLVHWSKERSCRVGLQGAGCVWAPEAVYDEHKEAFFVFYSSRVKLPGEADSKQRIYGTYTDDFREFTEPFIYMERENHVIDTTIVYAQDCYYRFSKDETNSRILLEKGREINGAFEKVESKTLDEWKGVEGPECYLLPDNRTWCLIIDQFQEGKGYLPLLTQNLASGEFQVLSQEQYEFGKNKKRHGGVLRLNDEEYDRLWKAFGEDNPVIDGLYADPDLSYFDGNFYLYPTTDGFAGWSGTTFSVFSSKDGKYFKNQGQILDLASKQVPWSIGAAWAPCIAQKNGKYYFYFCGKNKQGVSCIGAALADSPTGPFTAEKEPLLTMEFMHSKGIAMNQTIDPSIYTEGEDTYLLFGNGEPAIVKLSDDMLHIEEDTLVNLQGAFDFREAITVLKRNGRYYFSWSCDDTRSEEYHVNYGISDSLYGPIQYEGVLLAKKEDSLGTGHHSICHIPESDRYLIAFHRFATPVKKYAAGKGFNREVCIRELIFDSEGKMKVADWM
ncbi:MAG: family 43 glycosylhydrolase [Eubacteriales bacterium]|nr:family 43 glycosylhydrolase [Eubacteriales bacterium]